MTIAVSYLVFVLIRAQARSVSTGDARNPLYLKMGLIYCVLSAGEDTELMLRRRRNENINIFTLYGYRTLYWIFVSFTISTDVVCVYAIHSSINFMDSIIYTLSIS